MFKIYTKLQKNLGQAMDNYDLICLHFCVPRLSSSVSSVVVLPKDVYLSKIIFSCYYLPKDNSGHYRPNLFGIVGVATECSIPVINKMLLGMCLKPNCLSIFCQLSIFLDHYTFTIHQLVTRQFPYAVITSDHNPQIESRIVVRI